MKVNQPPVVTNSKGGSQSALLSYDEFLLDVIPALRQVLEKANFKYDKSPYDVPNWHSIPITDHTRHALAHLMRFQQHWTVGGHEEALDHGEDDVLHAGIRCLFAWYLLNQQPTEPDEDENEVRLCYYLDDSHMVWIYLPSDPFEPPNGVRWYKQGDKITDVFLGEGELTYEQAVTRIYRLTFSDVVGRNCEFYSLLGKEPTSFSEFGDDVFEAIYPANHWTIDRLEPFENEFKWVNISGQNQFSDWQHEES